MALGVLLDTVVVRSVLVTALNLHLGRWMWWPARLPAAQSAGLDILAAGPADLVADRESTLVSGPR